MAELIVVGFQGTHRAAEVLDTMQRLHVNALIDLKDGTAVYRTDSGRLRVDRSLSLSTKEETALGGVLGALIAAALALPFAALASVPVAAAALGIGSAAIGATGGAVMGFDESTSWKETFGISEDVVKQVGGMVQPGESAVFILGNAGDAARVVERFRGQGGTVLRTTLPPDEAKRLEQAIARPVPVPASVARPDRSA
jgi:uncharacterized membrane protein